MYFIIYWYMLFSELDIIQPILDAVDKQGYTTPTPIQEQSIPPILDGKDVLGSAQTWTGKTAAFAIPTLQILSREKDLGNVSNNIKCLILTPTRELAIQIEESFNDYGVSLKLKHAVIFGWVNQNPQVRKLKAWVDILIATPGRLLDLIGQWYIDLSHLEIFTLDEADRMLNMWFINDVKKVIKLLPQKRQNLFFSATMPKEIVHLADSILVDPIKVEVAPVSSTADSVDQAVLFVTKNDKKLLLAQVLQNKKMTSVLVFSRTKHGADRVVRELSRTSISAAAIHGNKSQNARQKALADFKSGKIRVLVATDIAARWIDIDELMFVINYDLPNEPETYVHRIWRTGRAWKDGVAISFCNEEEFEYLLDIEKLISKKIRRIESHPYAIKITAPLSAAEKKKANAEREARKREHIKQARARKGGNRGRR